MRGYCLSCLSIFGLLAPPAVASTVGNGGDVVVCPDRPAEMLDVYEARELRGIGLSMGSPELDPYAKAAAALALLAPHDPQRAETYLEWLREFDGEAKFKEGIELVDVPDSLHVFLPRGCALEQIAIQRDPPFEPNVRYIISKDLWDLLNADHQAALLLHEIVYRDAIAHHQTDSINARYFVAYLISGRLAGMSEQGYRDLIERAALEDFLE